MKKLPTVCFLTGTLNAFAGAERMTAVIANGLAERGYRVLVLSLYDRATVFPLHENVVHDALFEARPSFKWAYLPTVFGIRKFLRKHAVDVLVEVDTMLTLFTVPATLGMRVRRVAWEHSHFDEDLGHRARPVARRLAAGTNAAIVVLTERDRQRWNTLSFNVARIYMISNALPFDVPTAPALRQRPVLLAVGRLTHAKGLDVLLRAWARARMMLPDWHLRIVGEGEARDELERLCIELGQADSVTLPGIARDIGAEYRGASAFCLSSRHEGFGLVLIEAMAYGLPVVATDCETGPKALLRDGANAVVVPVEDADALAQAVVRVCTDTDLQRRLATNAREFATHFAPQQVITCWTTLLDQIAG